MAPRAVKKVDAATTAPKKVGVKSSKPLSKTVNSQGVKAEPSVKAEAAVEKSVKSPDSGKKKKLVKKAKVKVAEVDTAVTVTEVVIKEVAEDAAMLEAEKNESPDAVEQPENDAGVVQEEEVKDGGEEEQEGAEEAEGEDEAAAAAAAAAEGEDEEEVAAAEGEDEEEVAAAEGEDEEEEAAAEGEDEEEVADKAAEGEEEAAEGEAEEEEESHKDVEMASILEERKKRREFEVFVGGLGKDVVKDDLRKVFSEAGEVVEITTANKGFAFIRFAAVESARKAVEELNNVKIRGRRCAVERPLRKDTLHVRNICRSWTEETLRKKLHEYGVDNMVRLSLLGDQQRGSRQRGSRNRGFAFLEFATNTDATNAFKRLQKRDVTFGTAFSPLVEFDVEPDENMMAQVKGVFIDGLPPTWDRQRVKEKLSRYGEVERVELARDFAGAKRKDFAFINFKTREAALACIEGVNKKDIEGEGDFKEMKASLRKPKQKMGRSATEEEDRFRGRGGGRQDRGYGGHRLPWVRGASSGGRHFEDERILHDHDRHRSRSRDGARRGGRHFVDERNLNDHDRHRSRGRDIVPPSSHPYPRDNSGSTYKMTKYYTDKEVDYAHARLHERLHPYTEDDLSNSPILGRSRIAYPGTSYPDAGGLHHYNYEDPVVLSGYKRRYLEVNEDDLYESGPSARRARTHLNNDVGGGSHSYGGFESELYPYTNARSGSGGAPLPRSYY